LEGAPDEFIDPIMFASIIDDPVKLPVTNKIVDRKIIEKHLKDDPRDPFSR